jgi:hypothetical protein
VAGAINISVMAATSPAMKYLLNRLIAFLLFVLA